MFVFPRRLNQLSRFHRWVDLALLFKKGVGREIAALEMADNVFSSVHHSRDPRPVLKFCGRRTAGDLSQNTFSVQNFSWRLHLGSLEVNATLLQLCGSRWRLSHKLSPRLARQCGSQEKQRVQASRSNLEVLLNNVRTLGSKSSLKRQAQG